MSARVTRYDLAAVGTVVATLLLGVALWPRLPAEVAVHFSPTGEPGNYVSRTDAVVGLPAGMALTLLVLWGAGRLDPPNNPRVYGAVVWSTMVLLGAVHAYVLAWNLGHRPPFALVPVGVAVWAVLVVATMLRHER
jgi:uncharacterized membrane protein